MSDDVAVRTRGRLAGIDAARGLAVLGMFAAHLVPDGETENLADGRSSVLFATLAGMSLGLLSGGAERTPQTERFPVRRRIAIRALVLVLLGLMLWTLGSGIAIILDYYGVFFLVLLPVLFAPRLVLTAVVLAALGLGTALLADAPESPAGWQGDSLLLWLPSEWFVTGYYPGLLWLAYLVVGLVLARTGLGRTAVQLSMLAGGVVVSAVGYGTAAILGLDASAHSNTALEALGAGGLAVAIVGALSLAVRAPAVSLVLTPLRAVGAMPLTIYTAQILALALARSAAGGPLDDDAKWLLLTVLVISSLVFASLWRRFRGRGPLEALLARLTATPAGRPA